jgi:membrane protein required for colicin V production
MNVLDVVLALLLAASVFTSFRKGLSREIVGLVSVILALVLGIWCYAAAGSILLPYVSSPRVAHFIGFVLVFCGVMLAGSLVSFAIGKFLRVTGLSFFDHLLGAVFGLLRGALISVALILGIMAFSPEGKAPAVVVNSRLAPYVVGVARGFAAVAPHELKDDFQKTYAAVRQGWQDTLDKKLHPMSKAEGQQK